jgi:peptidoglycan/LPS O-acetylase OafA/YrhL
MSPAWDQQPLGLFALGLALTTLLSLLSYQGLELPTIAWGNRLWKKMELESGRD